jgi:ElaB/YqjD/DUF883 family membrane-anchored ribosome-binding protein
VTFTSDNPEWIRRDIERTQANLSMGVNAFADKVSPGRIVGRRADQARAALGRIKDDVMGADPVESANRSAHHLADSVSESASNAASAVSATAAGAVEGVQEAPEIARSRARGNPIAAGVVAFGVGWLVSSLLPPSRQEQRLAVKARQQVAEHAEPVLHAAKEAAGELKDQLVEPMQHAVDEVRSAAGEAGRAVAGEGRSATEQLQEQLGESAGAVRRSASTD